MKAIREFILRNKQIFITGVVIGLIFLLIISVSSSRKVSGPKLAPSKTTSESGGINQKGLNPAADYQPKGFWNAPIPQEYYENTQDETGEKNVEEPKEILEISFDNNGFAPKTSYALLNQTVRWINKTDRSIYIQQLKQYFPELENPVEVYPGGSLELKLIKTGVWGYKEVESGEMGSITITEVGVGM